MHKPILVKIHLHLLKLSATIVSWDIISNKLYKAVVKAAIVYIALDMVPFPIKMCVFNPRHAE